MLPLDSSKAIIDEIQQRINIVEVVREYVSLTKQGKNHVGLCPFHNEKTPSFSVSEEKNLFYCFGCGEGGNVFQFLMKYKNHSFPEALKELGKRVGIDVQSHPEKEDQFQFLLTIFNQTAHIFQHNLSQTKTGVAGLNYLNKRSINAESIQKFSIGYAPNDWTYLHSILSQKNYSLESQLKSALISKGKNNRYFDYFRHRIIFPIFDEINRIVAFGGRTIDDSNPKYLNSHENYYFKKRELLYGLNWAKESISQTGKAILVEGYFDVIMAHQMGITNVVAPLGTALTEKHIQKLKRYTDQVILVFDGDLAGEKAMIRGLSYTLKADIETKIVSLPDQLDPCDFILKLGRDAFLAQLDQAKPSLEYRIEWGFKKNPVENDFQKRQYLKDLFFFINTLESEVQKEECLKKAAELLDVSEKSVKQDYLSLSRKRYSPLANEKTMAQASPQVIIERHLLFTLISYPDFFPNYKSKIRLDTFQDSFSIKIFQIMFQSFEEMEKLDVHSVLEAIENEEYKKIFMDELFSEKYQFEPIKSIQDCLNKMKLNQIKFQRVNLSKKIAEAQQKDKSSDLSALLEDQQFLINEENKIKQREKVTWTD